jgi:hypothetical protein
MAEGRPRGSWPERQERKGGMKDSSQFVVRSGQPASASQPEAQLCPECGEVYVLGGGYCGECRRIENTLAREYAAWEQRSEHARQAELRKASRRPLAARILDWTNAVIGAVAFIVVVIAFAPWLIELWQMWFGGN